MPLHVIFAIDHHGWCFENIAQELVRRLSDEFRISIVPHLRLTKAECDILVAMWWGSLLRIKPNVRSRAAMACVYDGLSWKIDADAAHRFMLTAKHCDLIGACNEQFLQGLVDVLPEGPEVALIEDGVNTKLFAPAPMPDKVVIGWTGNSMRSTPGGPPDQKGLGMLKKACKQHGVSLNILDAAHGDPWTLQEMPEFYRTVSVMACPSYMEGTPNPMLEAMACGRPVLVTRSDASPEGIGLAPKLIKDGVNGFIVGRSEAGLGEGVRKIGALGLQELKLMGQRAREAVAATHSWEARAEAWRMVLRRCLAESATRHVQPPPRSKQRQKVKEIRVTASWAPKTEPPATGFSDTSVEEAQALIHQAERAAGDRSQMDRPSIWVYGLHRFSSRTIRIIERLAYQYRFVVLSEDQVPPHLVWALYPYAPGSQAARVARHYGVPLVTTARGAFWISESPHLQRLIPDCVGIYEQADCIISLSNTFVREVSRRWPQLAAKRFEIIPNGIEIPKLVQAPVEEFRNLKRSFAVCMTNLSFKGKWEAIRDLAAASSPGQLDGTIFFYADKSTYSPDKKVVGNGCYYMGGTDAPLLRMAYADAFIYPSYEDSQPTALMEALALGKACVVCKHPASGAHEFVTDGSTGLVYEAPLDGIRCLQRLFADPALRQRLGDAAKQDMQLRFQWAACAREHDKIFSGLIARR